MKLLLLFLIFFNNVIFAFGQTCPTNINFEFGDFNNWNVSAFADTIIISDTTKDACGAFPMLCPNGGKYTARIGDTLGTPLETDSQIVTYTYLVTSLNSNLNINYAIVIQDGNHALLLDNPYWRCTINDVSGNQIDELYYPIGQAGPPLYLISPTCPQFTCYLPWQTWTVDLNTYIGQTVTINNLVKNCKWGDHKCYVYLDACDLLLSKNEITEKIKIDFYPNPISSQAILRANVLLHNSILEIYNAQGQLVKKITNIKGNEITFQRDNLPAGIYIFYLSEGNQTISNNKFLIID
jgi:hypothetical protein